ncbi:hypothetical protein FHW12_003131 [Dokdonella fugitiva]|uniref:Uncharacterized protein n=1 Tax=Dokdonella fugitiva TaxID=328517 RepID=A0A839EYN6_9GAMM|nr:hypothetical protein [Dokdonella fugitiva]MBA8888895.1 hypothetical protein [Dokdonella fugitiva]
METTTATPKAATLTQRDIDEASCILSEARAVAHGMIEATNGDTQGAFGALSRLITSAKEIIDGEVRA